MNTSKVAGAPAKGLSCPAGWIPMAVKEAESLGKPVTVLRRWVWIDLPGSEAVIHARSTMIPALSYRPEGPITTGPMVSFSGCIFETKNSAYILAGPGRRRRANEDEIANMFAREEG